MVARHSDNSESGALPQWIAPTLRVGEGRDPLGLQSLTIDRLMPLLMPGVLELTQRARYISFHAFLLSEYRRRRLPADRASLSDFVRRCEWDYGLAVLLCPRGCGASPVGSLKLKPVVGQNPEVYPRGLSVESSLGGYGLYYRTPMEQFGIAARAGSLLGDTPIPIDVLLDTPHALNVAEGFGAAAEETQYVASFMYSPDREIPREVLIEYSEAACLCRLDEHPEERDAIATAIFRTAALEPPTNETEDPDEVFSPADPTTSADAVTRHRSFAVFLDLLGSYPELPWDSSWWRQAVWNDRSNTAPLQDVADAWMVVVAKDIWQDALCSIWSHFCRSGLQHQRINGPLDRDDQSKMIASLLDTEPALDSSESTSDVVVAIGAGRFDPESDPDLETFRRWTEEADTATSGLITLLALSEACADESSRGWNVAARLTPNWQPNLATSLADLAAHLETDPSVGETLEFVIGNFITTRHPRIAYSKMPEFTFRFRWEEGKLVFYDNGIGRFRLAGIRVDALTQLSIDLGYWANPDAPVVTDRGARLIEECP